MKVFLKVKLKSLTEEARIIKMEEASFPRGRRNHKVCVGLRDHRNGLRPNMRNAFLAYGFLRGRPYVTVENNPPDQAGL